MKNQQSGLVKFIVLLVIAIIVLGYFRVDLRRVVESLGAQANLQYAWGLVVIGWQNYFWPFLSTLWQLLTDIIRQLRQ